VVAGRFGVVFERDDETAYFYLLDLTKQESRQIVSAFNAYSITEMPGDTPVAVKWNPLGTAAGLFVSGTLVVIFEVRSGAFEGRWASRKDSHLSCHIERPLSAHVSHLSCSELHSVSGSCPSKAEIVRRRFSKRTPVPAGARRFNHEGTKDIKKARRIRSGLQTLREILRDLRAFVVRFAFLPAATVSIFG
jgi:hypothetical protein